MNNMINLYHTVPNCGKGFMKKSELVNHTNRCHAATGINFNSEFAL